MPIAHFEELCKGLCETAGFAPPSPRRSDSGALCCSIAFGGVMITAMAPEPAHPRTTVLIAEAGAVPPQAGAAAWLALLDANLFMMDVDAPRFSRNPVRGDVALHWVVNLDDVSVPDVYDRVERMVELVRGWRDGHFLTEPVAPVPAATPPFRRVRAPHDAVAVRAAMEFRRLCTGVVEVLSQTEPAWPEPGADVKLVLSSSTLGSTVTLGHSPTRAPEVAFVMAPLSPDAKRPILDCATLLLEANFALMMHPWGMSFCRDPWSGQLVLAYGHRLAGSTPAAFLRQLQDVLAATQGWEAVVNALSDAWGTRP